MEEFTKKFFIIYNSRSHSECTWKEKARKMKHYIDPSTEDFVDSESRAFGVESLLVTNSICIYIITRDMKWVVGAW